MERITLHLDVFASGKPSADWWLSTSIEMQRLHYIRSGTGWYRDGSGTMQPYRTGMVYLFPYNLPAKYESYPDDPIDHLYFDFISLPPIIANQPLVYDPTGHPQLQEALQLALTLSETDGPTRRETGYPLLELLLKLLENIRPLPYSADAVICDTLNYIEQHYAEPLTVKELAVRFHFEENHFIRRFKSEVGQTPYAYLKRFRLLRAREHLRQGCTLVQTAALVGYENASSLSRALRTLHEKTAE